MGVEWLGRTSEANHGKEQNMVKAMIARHTRLGLAFGGQKRNGVGGPRGRWGDLTADREYSGLYHAIVTVKGPGDMEGRY